MTGFCASANSKWGAQFMFVWTWSSHIIESFFELNNTVLEGHGHVEFYLDFKAVLDDYIIEFKEKKDGLIHT